MSFIVPEYKSPDFSMEPFRSAPDAALEEVKVAGVAPNGYHALSIYPEYFKVNGKWILARESRMDCVPVLTDEQTVEAVEFRKLKVGDKVVIGRTEDGSQGIYVYPLGFRGGSGRSDLFAFRSGRSRETAFSRDYDELYELLRHEKDKGYVVWVLGPAVVFDYDSRKALSALIESGYVHAILAGNAMATHDLEAAISETALGQSIYSHESVPNGHYHHLDLINKARAAGSIARLVNKEEIGNGVIYSVLKREVPLVLAGSIRDDGPLPGVFNDVYQAQDEMRKHTRRATTVICLASMLHTIATGNMTPSYVEKDGRIRPVYFYYVDIAEFAVNKLLDRGSLEVKTIVTNVQDFLVNLTHNLVEK